jgi:hypothetical protein
MMMMMMLQQQLKISQFRRMGIYSGVCVMIYD